YMTFVDKGEMRSYWVDDQDATIFPGSLATGLESIIIFEFSFGRMRRRLATRSSCKKHDILLILSNLDACHSVSVTICAAYYSLQSAKTYWKASFQAIGLLLLNYLLHCASDPNDRMDGVAPQQAILRHADLIANASGTRSHVMEVTASLKGSCRIINEELP
ncbi:hypothetical protein GN958_ATG01164, partial [Phytophthora infestans]